MLNKIGIFLYMLYCIESGFFLILVPWSALWEHSFILGEHPITSPLFSNGFFRGAITGFGIVLLCVGLSEALTYIRGWKFGHDAS